MAENRPADKWQPWPLLTPSQIEGSPSFLEGMTLKTEKTTRRTYMRVMHDAGVNLKQNMETIATAQTYFTRFYAVKSFQSTHPFLMAIASLLVASKTEMKPRPLNHVICACWYSWVDKYIKGQMKAAKNKNKNINWRQLHIKEAEAIKTPQVYNQLYEGVCSAERCLLYTTNFQFNVMTAFHALLQTTARLRKLPDPAMVKFFSEIDEMDKQLGADSFMQAVWNFVITIYDCTRLCLQYDPRAIGIACFELACKLKNLEVPFVNGEAWWRFVAKREEFDWDFGSEAEKNMRSIQKEVSVFFKSIGEQPNGYDPFAFLREEVAKPSASPLSTPAPGSSPAVAQVPGSGGPSPATFSSSQTQEDRLDTQDHANWTPGPSPDFRPSHPQPQVNGNAPPLPQPNNQKRQFLAMKSALSTDPPPLPQEAYRAEGRLKRERPPEIPSDQVPLQAEKRVKTEAGFNFSPSAEFSISPPRELPIGLPSLESRESGELTFDEEPLKPASQDPDVIKARLAKARQLGAKSSQENPPVKISTAIDKGVDDDFSVHFSP